MGGPPVLGGPTTSDVGGGNCSGGGGPLMTTGRPGRVMTTEEEGGGGGTDVGVGGDALLKLSVGKGLFGSLVKVGPAAAAGAEEEGVTQTLWVVEGGCLWWSIKLWICSDFMS